MPSEYDAFVAALQATGVPFAECAWDGRPDSSHYGTVSLDFEGSSDDGDDLKQERSWEGTVDLYSKAKRGGGHPAEIEEILTETCGDAWELSAFEWVPEVALFHWVWEFRMEG